MIAASRLTRGMPVLSAEGRVVGRVEDRIPADGGGEASFAVVRGRRFGGELKLLPVAAARHHPGAVQLTVRAPRIADAPAFDPAQETSFQVWRATRYWGDHADVDASRLGFGRLAKLRD